MNRYQSKSGYIKPEVITHGWKGKRRSRIAPAMRHGVKVVYPLTDSTPRKGDDSWLMTQHPAYTPIYGIAHFTSQGAEYDSLYLTSSQLVTW